MILDRLLYSILVNYLKFCSFFFAKAFEQHYFYVEKKIIVVSHFIKISLTRQLNKLRNSKVYNEGSYSWS